MNGRFLTGIILGLFFFGRVTLFADPTDFFDRTLAMQPPAVKWREVVRDILTLLQLDETRMDAVACGVLEDNLRSQSRLLATTLGGGAVSVNIQVPSQFIALKTAFARIFPTGGRTPYELSLDSRELEGLARNLVLEERFFNEFRSGHYKTALALLQRLHQVNPAHFFRPAWLLPFPRIGVLTQPSIDTGIVAQIYGVAGFQVNRLGPFSGEITLTTALSNTRVEVLWIQQGTTDFPVELALGMGTYKSLEYVEVNNGQLYLQPVGTRSSAFHLGDKTGFLILTVLYQARDPRFSLSRRDEVFIRRG